MNNIRVSVNLGKIRGSRVLNIKDEQGKSKPYVCIPVDECFVPKESPSPYLMFNLIHCPNSIYNDWMVKPYMSAADYKNLSREEQMAIPSIGSGSFVQPKNGSALARTAEVVDASPTVLQPTKATQPTNGPAAGVGQNSFPANGGTQAAVPSDNLFVVLSSDGTDSQFRSWNEAEQYAAQDYNNRARIVCWQGEKVVADWLYDPWRLSWIQQKLA